MNQAAGRVAPEQSALGAAQNFDSLKIKQSGVCRAHVGVIDLVLINRHRRFLVVVKIALTNAAQRQRSDIALPARISQGEARRHIDQFIAVVQVQLFQLLPPEGRDGNAHILEVLLAFLRGDHDLFQHKAGFLRDGCAAGGGQANNQDLNGARHRRKKRFFAGFPVCSLFHRALLIVSVIARRLCQRDMQNSLSVDFPRQPGASKQPGQGLDGRQVTLCRRRFFALDEFHRNDKHQTGLFGKPNQRP